MAQIQPVIFPLIGTATTLEVTVLSFSTSAVTATTSNRLLTNDGVECVPSWNYVLSNEQFAAWGQDNSVVDGYVAQDKGLVIVP
jgi:hypothetical protein